MHVHVRTPRAQPPSADAHFASPALHIGTCLGPDLLTGFPFGSSIDLDSIEGRPFSTESGLCDSFSSSSNGLNGSILQRRGNCAVPCSQLVNKLFDSLLFDLLHIGFGRHLSAW